MSGGLGGAGGDGPKGSALETTRGSVAEEVEHRYLI